MRLKLSTLSLAVGAVFAAGAEIKEMDLDRQTPVAGDRVVPITDFFRPPYLSSPTVNLAGTHVAALVTGGSEKPQLMMIRLADGDRQIVSGSRERMVHSLQWLGNDHLAFRLSMDKRFDMGLMVARLDDLDDPYPINQFGFARIIGVPRDNPLEPLVWVRSGGRQRSAGLYVLDADLNTGAVVRLGRTYNPQAWDRIDYSNQRHIKKRFPEPPGGEDTNYIADVFGNLMMAYTVDQGMATAHLWDGEQWTPSPVDLDEVRILAVGDRWGEVIAQPAAFDGERTDVKFLDMATGAWGESLLRDEEYDYVGGFYRDPASLKLVGAVYQRDGPAVLWFDPSYATLQKVLDNAFAGKVVRIVDADETGDNLIVHVFGDRNPAEYYLVNLAKKSIDLIAKSRPWLDSGRLRPMNIIQFKTAEGQELDAYVTMPEGASKEKPPPLLVIPHGGPWARDNWGFDAEAQFWASRGYAVIQPNYRGSPGYDWKFPAADRFEFLKMHDDVTRAAQTMVRSGYADPDRVAIMGASFGGYLALSGAVHEPDFYKCALTFAGVFDWKTVIRGTRFNGNPGQYDFLRRRLGDPAKEAEKFEAISPVRHIERVKVPVFVAHGREDETALVSQSKQLIRELKKHDVEHESWIINQEGHGTAELENRVELMTRMEAFLREHL